jgi:TM2 domain-containing membrane protein YozV
MNDQLQPQSNGLATAAMVLGIVGLVLAFIPLLGLLSWALCPAAIITGAMSVNKATGKGSAITGIITGIIGLLICIAWVTAFAAIGSAAIEEAEKAKLETAT